jgi:hypothetical protein
MQQADQEMRFTEDPFLHEGKKVGYLNPLRISENEHTIVMGPDHDKFVGQSEAEITKIRVKEQQKQETAVSTYIGNTFLQYQDRRIIRAPYMFKYVLVVNSLNNFYLQSSYCLNTWLH